jgi:hypothetical protein
MRCPQDIQGIDLGDIGDTDAIGTGAGLCQNSEKGVAFTGSEAFRIIDGLEARILFSLKE